MNDETTISRPSAAGARPGGFHLSDAELEEIRPRSPRGRVLQALRLRRSWTSSWPPATGRCDGRSDLTSMTDLPWMIATKAISPLEVVRAHPDRIAALDRDLRAYITRLRRRRATAARAAEAELMAGRPVGPLHGVPYALKRSLRHGRDPHDRGSRILGDRVPEADATATRRLGEAGAILLGKLNMVEFAYGPKAALTRTTGTRATLWDRPSTAWPAARRRDPALRSRRVWRPGRWAPTPVAPSDPVIALRHHRPGSRPTGG